MKYYKIVENNNIVGIATSNNFMRYAPQIDSYKRSDEQSGEYISYNGKFYRSGWMAPYTYKESFVSADIVEILESEYNIYKEAFKSQSIIEQAKETEPIEETESTNYEQQASIEFLRQSKISEMSHECRKTIEAGIDIQLRMETKHFSMDTQDQLNLMSLGVMAQTQELIPYHADGETCIFYTADEINQIVAAATAHKVYHTTYYNALKNYINSLTTIEEIAAITYGTPIPDEYQSEVLKVITQ